MLNCETCAQTQHHCCKASISFNVMEIIDLSEKADKLGIEVKVMPSKEKPNYFNIIERDKPFKDLNDTNCIFLSNGKCKIYEERPSICKVYGSETVKCWFNKMDFDTPATELFEKTVQDINSLTQDAMIENEKTVIAFFQDKMKN